MFLRPLILPLLLTLSALPLRAQLPRHFFRNPLGIPVSLSANFGELRPGHWHMGLDMRTNQKENLPVYAAAAGYIAKVGVRPQSFGRFIIIHHPNGLSTLYAHLNDFFPELEKYVTEQQYKKESWAVELNFTPDQFPVSKGSFIAYSGNTGGSRGPHLHFEIITTSTERRHNPLLYDLVPEDGLPPVIQKLAVYDRRSSLQGTAPLFIDTRWTDSGYVLPKRPVLRTGWNRIAFGLQAFDKMIKGGSDNGIYAARLFVNDTLVFSFRLDSMDYEETGFIDAHTDYGHRYRGGGWYQRLFRLPGDRAPIYDPALGDGVLTLTDTVPRALRLEVSDAAGHTRSLRFSLQYSDSLAALQPLSAPREQIVWAPNQVNRLQEPAVEAWLPGGALYDTVYLPWRTMPAYGPASFSPAYTLGDPAQPLHESLIVRLKLSRPVPERWQDRLLILRTDPKGRQVRKGLWEEDWITGYFPEFGTFQVVADTIPPALAAPGPRAKGRGDTLDLSRQKFLALTPTDNYGIRRLRAEINGAWQRFTNDKSRTWLFPLDELPYGTHTLRVTVEDLAGNVGVREWVFVRGKYVTPVPKKKKGKKM